MSLATDIAGWDQKKVAPLVQTYNRHAQEVEFADQIIGMLGEAELEAGASWLLKRHFESGFHPSRVQVNAIHRSLPQLQGWAAQLHLLQCLGHWPIPRHHRDSTAAFLEAAQEHPKTLVRAWSLNGWYYLAAAFPAERPRVQTLLEQETASPAGSIAARARRLLQQPWA